MKTLLHLTLAACLLGVRALPADDKPAPPPVAPASVPTVTPEQLGQYIGKTVTLKGVVSQVKKVKGNCVILDFGGNFPNQVCSAFLTPPMATSRDWTSAVGTEVSLTGPCQLYRGKPQVKI